MFELCRYRVANLTSCSEFMSESETVAKNRIEFQWGSKLQGTSSEALVVTWWYFSALCRFRFRDLSHHKPALLPTEPRCLSMVGYSKRIPSDLLLYTLVQARVTNVTWSRESSVMLLIECNVIRQNESELANTVFKIQPNKADSFNCLYLWNQLPNLCGVFSKLREVLTQLLFQNLNFAFFHHFKREHIFFHYQHK